jgi:hypothetical protein
VLHPDQTSVPDARKAAAGVSILKNRSDGKTVRRNKMFSGQWSARPIDLLNSPAYRVLTRGAHMVMSRIEIELRNHGGRDNGKLPVTFENFVEYGMDRHAIAPAIRELEALGIIRVTERGRAGNAEFRTPNLFFLTFANARDGCAPPNDWQRIKTMEEAEQMARAARQSKFSVGKTPTENRKSKKQKSSGGKRTASVGETHTENDQVPVGKTPTTAPVRFPPLLSISGRGVTDDEAII